MRLVDSPTRLCNTSRTHFTRILLGAAAMGRISLPARTYIRKAVVSSVAKRSRAIASCHSLLTVVSSLVGVDKYEIAPVTDTLGQRMCRV